MKKLIFILLTILAALAACTRKDDLATEPGPAPVSPGAQGQPAAASGRVPVYHGADIHAQAEVHRFIDGDAGVLCYQLQYGNGHPSAISCVPLSHTMLRLDGTSRYDDVRTAP